MECDQREKEIGVVVPARDRQELLSRALDSIKAQTWRPVHLVVVDNGSSDGTLAVARDWAAANAAPDFRVTVAEEPEAGACPARQRGLREVTAPYVAFFDSDDTMRPDLLATAMETFGRKPETDLVTWCAELHFLDGTSRVTVSGGDPLDTHLIHGLLRTQGYAVRTELLRRVGGWRGNLPVWNDWELGVRLLCASPTIETLPECLADVYSQENSITGKRFSDKFGSWERSLDEVERLLGEVTLDRRDHYLRLVAYRRMILAAHYAREGRGDLALSLLKEALANPALTRMQRMFFRILYRYTAAGGRGAGRVAVLLV